MSRSIETLFFVLFRFVSVCFLLSFFFFFLAVSFLLKSLLLGRISLLARLHLLADVTEKTVWRLNTRVFCNHSIQMFVINYYSLKRKIQKLASAQNFLCCPMEVHFLKNIYIFNAYSKKKRKMY